MIDDLLIAATAAAPVLLYRWRARVGQKPQPNFAAWGLLLCFIYCAMGHFILNGELVEMLPPFVPFRSVVIYGTGALELLVATALAMPRRRRHGAITAIMLLVLFLPANIYACLNHVGVGEHKLGPIYLAVRIPLQLWLIGVALAVMRLDSTAGPSFCSVIGLQKLRSDLASQQPVVALKMSRSSTSAR